MKNTAQIIPAAVQGAGSIDGYNYLADFHQGQPASLNRIKTERIRYVFTLEYVKSALWAELTKVKGYDIEGNIDNLANISRWIEAVLSGKTMRSLYIFSETFGNGKTTVAEAVAKVIDEARLMNGHDGCIRRVSATRIADEILTDPKAHHIAYATDVLLDDIGAGNVTIKYFGNVLDWVSQTIQRRYERFRKGNGCAILTSNIEPNDLPASIGGRAADRMAEMFTFIHWQGKSHRQWKG